MTVITIRGDAQVAAALAELGPRGTQLVAAELFQQGERIMARSKAEFVPADLGTLRASGHVRPPVIGPRSVDVELAYGGPAAPYALVQHEGRRPGSRFPPPEPIAAWARRKGIPEEAVFPIQRKIALEGTPAFKYLERPAFEQAPQIPAAIAARLQRELVKQRGSAR